MSKCVHMLGYQSNTNSTRCGSISDFSASYFDYNVHVIGPISGIVLFKVVYINKWSTPQEAASWLHEPASMYEVIPSKPISTEEFTAKQLQ